MGTLGTTDLLKTRHEEQREAHRKNLSRYKARTTKKLVIVGDMRPEYQGAAAILENG